MITKLFLGFVGVLIGSMVYTIVRQHIEERRKFNKKYKEGK